MPQIRRFTVTCPYCGGSNTLSLDDNEIRRATYQKSKFIVTCAPMDEQEEGCEKDFIVEMVLQPVVSYYRIDPVNGE